MCLLPADLATAMKVLKAKLWKVHLETVERDKKLSTIGQGDNSWGGNQIRFAASLPKLGCHQPHLHHEYIHHTIPTIPYHTMLHE